MQKVFRLFVMLAVLSLLLVPAPAKAATPCGGNVTHTATQSKLWGPASWSVLYDDAEWSGFVKYNPPSGKSCDVRFTYTVDNGGGGPLVGFRRSTTNIWAMQWDPPACTITGTLSGWAVNGYCEYAGVSSQKSNRVKLIADVGTGNPTYVGVVVYEKDSAGAYQNIFSSGWILN